MEISLAEAGSEYLLRVVGGYGSVQGRRIAFPGRERFARCAEDLVTVPFPGPLSLR
jgi:hypothetical protein